MVDEQPTIAELQKTIATLNFISGGVLFNATIHDNILDIKQSCDSLGAGMKLILEKIAKIEEKLEAWKPKTI